MMGFTDVLQQEEILLAVEQVCSNVLNFDSLTGFFISRYEP